jgi:hypothetical protein
VARWIDAKKDGPCSNPKCGKKIVKGDYIYAHRAGVYLCGECGLVAENEPRLKGSIEEGVEYELEQLPSEAGKTVIAQQMLMMAREMDEGFIPPREMTQYTKEQRLNLAYLKDLYPPEAEDDATAQAREQREKAAKLREQFGTY